MKSKLSVLLICALFVLAACGTPQASNAPTIPPAGEQPANPTAESGAPARMSGNISSLVSIKEVGLGQNGYVALHNFTDVPVSLEGTYLCQATACFGLPPAVIPPGQTGIVALGNGAGLNNVVATQATIGELRSTDGEIGLFASEVASSEQMLNYLEWGSTPHALTNLAINRGIWLSGSFAPTSPAATRLYRVEESGLWLFDE